MTLIFAPVSFSKSGARRCSGSAICGPVNVTRLTVTPSKGFCDFLLPPAPQAATTSTAITRNATNPYRFIPGPPSLLGAPGQPRPQALPADALIGLETFPGLLFARKIRCL